MFILAFCWLWWASSVGGLGIALIPHLPRLAWKKISR